MTDLYSLSTALARIHDELDLAGGELTPDLEQRLDGAGLALNEKAAGIGRWLRNLDGNQIALDAEIKRLQLRKEQMTNLEKRLKDYLLKCMQVAGKAKLEFETFTVYQHKNPPSCEIIDALILSSRYMTFVPSQYVVNKKAVLDALKDGDEVVGAKLADEKYHLRVK